MITDGFTYLAVLAFFVGLVVTAERVWKDAALFKYLPGVVQIYFVLMVVASAGAWDQAAVKPTYDAAMKEAILPAMVFLMLLRCDMRRILALGPRMLAVFFTATLSICCGFVVVFALFRGWYEPDTWKAFAALCGSWIGGTGNMVAVQGALGIPDSRLGYALLMDSVCYSVWVMFLLAVVPAGPRFNRWVGADTRAIDEIGDRLAREATAGRQAMEFADLALLLGTGLFLAALARQVAPLLPTTGFLETPTWVVLLVTLLGVGAAMTPLGRIPGSGSVANLFLYLMVALMASRANFRELTSAPLYLLSGFCIVAVHAGLMVVAARVFRFDLFSCGVASLANIGGIASAPILAAAYRDVLVPVGVLMGLLGYVVGTGGGLAVGKILSLMSGAPGVEVP